MTKLVGDGSLFLTEKASADADISGDFQVDVLNTAPNILRGTSDTGVTHYLHSTLGTVLDTSSGASSYTFSGIPSGVKEISVMFFGVTFSSTSYWVVRIGTASGIETSGYDGSADLGLSTVNFTDGYGIFRNSATQRLEGFMGLKLMDSSTNTWVAGHSIGRGGSTDMFKGGGSKNLSAELTQLIFTTQGGSNTGSAGKINIQYSF